MVKQDIEQFIRNSSALFEAYPSTTLLSVTYSNEQKKKEKRNSKGIAKDSQKRASNSVTFKCYEPNSGKCLRYKTNKSKELSRLLTFTGPIGVSCSSRKINSGSKKDSSGTSQSQEPNTYINGVASIMANQKFEIIEESETKSESKPDLQAEKESTPVPHSSSTSKNKKKKKGKK